MRLLKIVGIVISSLLVISAVAWASIPDSNGIFYACYSTTGNPNTKGLLRIVDIENGEVCAPGEGRIAWRERERPLYVKVQTFDFPVGPHQNTLLYDPNDLATGGGFRVGTTVNSVRIEASNPTLSLNGWQLTIQNDAGSLLVMGEAVVHTSSTAVAQNVFGVSGFDAPAAVSFDLTADAALALTADWSAASSSNTLTGILYVLEALN
jgi:hypothetical protein